jgi:MYXO-CTERM domain-containing protein
MSKALSIAALLAIAGAANGQVVISEILASTSGSDWEYIELVNLGAAPVDISGWSIELWDSDAGAQFGTLDAASPYSINPGTFIPAGGAWVIGNTRAFDGDLAGNADGYDDGVGNESFASVDFFRNQAFLDNSVENSAFTAILADVGLAVIDSWYMADGGAGDLPNRAGIAMAPNLTAGPDGTFLPAGAYRVGNTLSFLNFAQLDLNNGTLAGGTPGYNQIPAPGALALVGVAGLASARRRRA